MNRNFDDTDDDALNTPQDNPGDLGGAVDSRDDIDPQSAATSSAGSIPTRRTSAIRGTLVKNARGVVALVGAGALFLGASGGLYYGWDAHQKRTAAETASATDKANAEAANKAKVDAVEKAGAAEGAKEKAVADAKAAEEAKEKAVADAKAAEEAKEEAVAEAKAAEEARAKAVADAKAAEEAKEEAVAEAKAAEEAKTTAEKSRKHVFEDNGHLANYVSVGGAVGREEESQVLEAVKNSKVVPEHVHKATQAEFLVRRALKARAASAPESESQLAEALTLAMSAEASAAQAGEQEAQVRALSMAASIHEARKEFDEAIDLLDKAIALAADAKAKSRLQAARIRLQRGKLKATTAAGSPKVGRRDNEVLFGPEALPRNQIQFVTFEAAGPSRKELQDLVDSASSLVEGGAPGADDPACLYTLAITQLDLADHIVHASPEKPDVSAASLYVSAIDNVDRALRAYRGTPAEQLDDLHGQLLSGLIDVQDRALQGRLSFESPDVIKQLRKELEVAKRRESEWAVWATLVTTQSTVFKIQTPVPMVSDRLSDTDTTTAAWMRASAENIRTEVANLVTHSTGEDQWSNWATALSMDFKFSSVLPGKPVRWTESGAITTNSWMSDFGNSLRTMRDNLAAESKRKNDLKDSWTPFASRAAEMILFSQPPAWFGDADDSKKEFVAWQEQFLAKLAQLSPNKNQNAEHLASVAFAEGAQLFFRGCRAEAEEKFATAIRLDPRNPDAYYFRALTINDNWWSCSGCGVGCHDDCGNLGARAGEATEDVRVYTLLRRQGIGHTPSFLRSQEKIQGCARHWIEAEIKGIQNQTTTPSPSASMEVSK